jgi:hypothetical protein
MNELLIALVVIIFIALIASWLCGEKRGWL